MIDPSKLNPEEREFVANIVKRLDSGDTETVGSELLTEFRRALTPEVMQRGYRLGDVLCQAGLAKAFNEVLREENRTPLHWICVGFALAKQS